MISYKPLLKLMIDRDISKTALMNSAKLSTATMAKLNTNEFVALNVIDKLCKALNVQPSDLIEYIEDKN